MLVQWMGQGIEEATWEDKFNIRSQIPQLRQENKSPFEGPGIDRTESMGLDLNGKPKIWRVYARRNGGVERRREVGYHICKS